MIAYPQRNNSNIRILYHPILLPLPPTCRVIYFTVTYRLILSHHSTSCIFMFQHYRSCCFSSQYCTPHLLMDFSIPFCSELYCPVPYHTTTLRYITFTPNPIIFIESCNVWYWNLHVAIHSVPFIRNMIHCLASRPKAYFNVVIHNFTSLPNWIYHLPPHYISYRNFNTDSAPFPPDFIHYVLSLRLYYSSILFHVKVLNKYWKWIVFKFEICFLGYNFLLWNTSVIVSSHWNQRWFGIKQKITIGEYKQWIYFTQPSIYSLLNIFISEIKKCKPNNMFYKINLSSQSYTFPTVIPPGFQFCSVQCKSIEYRLKLDNFHHLILPPLVLYF